MKRKDQEQRYQEMLHYEKKAAASGYILVAGVDEAGRGPLAGPVAAAACILDPDRPIYGLNDSKKLSAKKRFQLYSEITDHALGWRVAFVDAGEIDRINIRQATLLAMKKAVQSLPVKADLLLVDAETLPDMNCWPIKKGDALSVTIAAASILAKVTRDRLMAEYDLIYPGYGLAQHKGYGTSQHYAALKELGPSPIHRLTFLKSFWQDLQQY